MRKLVGQLVGHCIYYYSAMGSLVRKDYVFSFFSQSPFFGVCKIATDCRLRLDTTKVITLTYFNIPVDTPRVTPEANLFPKTKKA